jgi:hypothetical protein
VTGEVAEYVAAETLGLTLARPRTPGYDALRGSERIQIKGRAHGKKTDSGQKMGRIKTDAPFDSALLVLLDNATLDPREMLEASFKAVIDRLAVPGSKARGGACWACQVQAHRTQGLAAARAASQNGKSCNMALP